MFSGYTVLGFMWAQMASVNIARWQRQRRFLRQQIGYRAFLLDRLLPRTGMHATAAFAGADSVMALLKISLRFDFRG